MRFVYQMDGEMVPHGIMNEFSFCDGDVKFSKADDSFHYDFVGFIINPSIEKTLVVFPKHFFTEAEQNDHNINNCSDSEDASVLFSLIKKYFESASSIITDNFFGHKRNYSSNYPFSSFYSIYDYYKKHGLFKTENKTVVKGIKGKINWKKTIQSSEPIVSGESIVFLDIYSEKNDLSTNFISDCMAFAINYTTSNYSFLVKLPSIAYSKSSFDFLKNSEFVIKKLKTLQASQFKDIHRKLIEDLITFFVEMSNKKHGGDVQLKIPMFQYAWQTIIGQYLNDCFNSIGSSGEVVFGTKGTSTLLFSETAFEVDDSYHDFKVIPDHYAETIDDVFIFDSKYYNKLDELNYKQFSYNCLLGLPKDKKVHSVLFLPGTDGFSSHFKTKKGFQISSLDNEIVEQYISSKRVIINYLAD